MSFSKESTELILADQTDIEPDFPKGSRTERQGNLIYIYDPSGKKRWELQDFVMDWEKTRRMRLGLQALAGGITWHTSMGAYRASSSVTDAEIETGIEVMIISGDTSEDDTTPAQQVIYTTGRNGNLYMAYGSGYVARRERVEADLQAAKVVALTVRGLPRQIDVNATVQSLVQSFREGKFEPPAFVLPIPQKLMLPLIGRNLSLPWRSR